MACSKSTSNCFYVTGTVHIHTFTISTNECTQYSEIKYKSYSTIHGMHTSEGDQNLDWLVGLIFFCYSRLSEDGSPVPKHVGVGYLS